MYNQVKYSKLPSPAYTLELSDGRGSQNKCPLSPCTVKTDLFSALFAKLLKVIIRFVISVRPRGTPRSPIDGNSWNFIFQIFFLKICLQNLKIVQQDETYSVYYISVGSSTCFGCWHPSSGARTTVITASGTGQPDLLPSALDVGFELNESGW